MKMTKMTKKTFLEIYKKNNGHVANACESVGISRNCFYEAYRKDQKFQNAIKEIKEGHDESLVVLAKEGLVYNLLQKKQSAIEYTLNNKCKDEFSNTVRNELTGKDGTPLQFIIEKTYDRNDTKKENQADPEAD